MRRWSFLARPVDIPIGPAVFKAPSRLLLAVATIQIQTRISILRMRISWRMTITTTTTTLLIILTSLVRGLHTSPLQLRNASLLQTRKSPPLQPSQIRLTLSFCAPLLLRLLNLPTDTLSNLAHLLHSTIANLSSSFRAAGEIRN